LPDDYLLDSYLSDDNGGHATVSSRQPEFPRRLLCKWIGLSVGGASLAAHLAPGAIFAATGGRSGEEAESDGFWNPALILSQERWSTKDLEERLDGVIAVAAAGRATALQPTLILLPPAEVEWGAIANESDVFAAIAARANGHRVYLAGAATVTAKDSGQTETIGFIFSPTGQLLARVPKVTPDFASGFSDSSARMSAPAEFPVVATPLGKLGLLVGEDLLMPGLVRGAMLSGAEVLLNPAVLSDSGGVSQAVEELPQTIAYENWMYVAVATAGSRQQGDARVSLPTRSGLFDWQGDAVTTQGEVSFLRTHPDPEVLRRARAHVSRNRYDNYPLILRDAVYGAVYAHLAELRGPARTPEARRSWWREARRRSAAQRVRRTPENQLLDGYYALMAQPHTLSPLPSNARREGLMRNITESLALVEGRARRPDSKIVVFPEFCFSGAGYRTVEDVISVAMRLPGPEMDVLSEFAQRNNIYIAAQAMEKDETFPDRIFNTAFLINDSGDLIHRHRKVQCVDVIGALRDHTPGSIFERYVEEFGIESLFSVADTPLGKIGHIICFEIIFPEVLRLMALEGAELLVHSTSEGWGSVKPMWHACRRKRAYENTAYLLMSNTGYDPSRPKPWIPYGESQFIDYRGNTRDAISHNGPEVLQAWVDMAALRSARRDARVNIPLWDEPGAYAHIYNQGHAVPNELWNGDPFEFPYRDGRVRDDVLERFYQRGIYLRPGQGRAMGSP
jgi:predicted amidohydrolase